jgi:hypothetical protein
MSSATSVDAVACILSRNRRQYRRKLQEHQRRALWARHAYDRLRPSNDAGAEEVPTPPFTDPHPFDASPRRSSRMAGVSRPPFADFSSEDGSDEEEGADFPESFGTTEREIPETSTILAEIIRNAQDPRSSGIRYSEETRQWAFELLRTCGTKALAITRRIVPLPSRQSFYSKPPMGYTRSDLTNFSLVADRIHAWRKTCGEDVRCTDYPRCILACDALACKPSVEVTRDGLHGLDSTDFDLGCDLFESLTSSRVAFQEFVQGHWDHVVTAAFVFQVQPLNPKLASFLVFAEPTVDGKARPQQVEVLKSLKTICGKGRMTIGGFAIDGDSGYDHLHEEQLRLNLEIFRKKPWEIPLRQRYHPISDVLHLLKRARYRMLKRPSMVVGLDTSSAELNLECLINSLRDDLSPIVFSDEAITKMHDSLPMVLFRFDILLKLYEARELGWTAYFFPWVLINEAMSHKDATTDDRVKWFRIAYCYLMKCIVTYHDRHFGVGIRAFGRKGDGPAVRRPMFDRTLLMHATNTISAIVYEISSATTPISLQRISTVCLEKRFGVTRMHAGVHQTLCGILKTMEIDEAMKFVYARAAVANRRLAYGAIVNPFKCLEGIGIDTLIFAECLLSVVGFPILLSQVVLDLGEDGIHVNVEKLMSDVLLPFAKTKVSMMSFQKRRSLYQELYGVSPSSRRVILSSKSRLKRVIEPRTIHPIEAYLAGLLGRITIPAQQLRILVAQTCDANRLQFNGRRQLNRSTKKEILEWIEASWETIGNCLTLVVANQRRLPVPLMTSFRIDTDQHQ